MGGGGQTMIQIVELSGILNNKNIWRTFINYAWFVRTIKTTNICQVTYFVLSEEL